MAEGTIRLSWPQTALLATILANTHRDPQKHRPCKIKDFLPYKPDVAAKPLESLGPLKAAFVGRKGHRS